MRKLSLNADDLAVQSFATFNPEVHRGTVRANDNTDVDTCNGPGTTCASGCTRVDTCPQVTCAASCAGTCASCPATCGCISSDGRC
jgi:hypothetical protein